MKKIVRLFLVAVALLAGAQLYAQNESIPFASVDEKPLFQGSEAGDFSFWVFGQIKYPEEAFKNKISGRVTLQFVIATDGKVKDVKILRGSGNQLLDDEAVRVISMSPDWTPGKVDGKPVNVRYIFPVVFKMTGAGDTTANANAEEEPVPFAMVEEKPTFQGGDANAFTKWMFDKIKYPEEAKKNKIQGMTALQFVISKTGKVMDVKVAKSSGNQLLDDEAVRVISMSPDWTPGKLKGKAVDVKYVFPVVFMLR